MSIRFLTHYPFAELINMGWRAVELRHPVMRNGARDFVRVAVFEWGNASICFDVTRHGEMSQFATYTRGEDVTLIAETAQAAVLLCASSPKATPQELAAIPDVTECDPPAL